ncbi:MAG TPA: RsmE family RNA methyltransferase [Polyangiaceae bacterium]|nr:RsmE family RNA methyltransferase [Polyangiaceae bacterium]
MNIVLLDPGEANAEGEVTLQGDRARHLLSVLKVQPGGQVRIGVLDGPQGRAEVSLVTRDSVALRCAFDQPSPALGEDTLLLGFARPKVLQRCLEHATALGFGKIILFRSRRVEKSHLSSHALLPAAIEERLRRGLEQSRRTHRPAVHQVLRFRQLVEEQLPLLVPLENRFVADGDAPVEAALAHIPAAPLSLVIGPEGGLSDHELESFASHGFQLVRAGREPLRVETALSYLTGQLRAARSRSSAG